MKNIANILTALRIFLSFSLIFLLNNLPLFIIIYIICGLSDALDGFIARKTNTQSNFGAKLDSAADLLMFGIITISLIFLIGSPLKNYIIFIAAIAFIRIANFIIAFIKYRSFVSLHTWGNKLTGLLVFMSPVLFIIFRNINLVSIVCTVALLASLEESVIHLTSKKPDLNRRGILFK